MLKKISCSYLKFLLTLLFFISVYGKSSYAQGTDNVYIKNLIETFNQVSDQDYIYDLKFIQKDSTFILKKENTDTKIIYTIPIKQIHPEGIYLDRDISTNTLNLKLISINNYNSFIKTKYYRKSKFTEIINIVNFDSFRKNKELLLEKFVKNIRAFLKNNNKQEESDDIYITTPKN